MHETKARFILTIHNEVEYLLRAVDIGINGYLLKDSESAELKKAILSVVGGEDYIQPSLIPALNSKMIEKNEDEIKIESLTKRELQVLKELAVGKFNRDIAKEMEISDAGLAISKHIKETKELPSDSQLEEFIKEVKRKYL